MKKIFFTFIVLSIALNAWSAKLVVFSESHVKFYLFLDETRINNVALDRIEIDKVSLGDHRVQVKLYNSNIMPFDEQIVITEEDVTYEYIVITKGVRPIIKFYAAYSFLYLKDHGYLEKEDNSKAVSSDVVNVSAINSKNNRNQKTVEINNKNTQGMCDTTISKDVLNRFLQELQEKTFDDTKEIMVRQFIKNNCVSSSQLALILQHFDYEDTKLSVAKFAYKYIYDKNNYYLINSVFEYSSTVDKLNKYINNLKIE